MGYLRVIGGKELIYKFDRFSAEWKARKKEWGEAILKAIFESIPNYPAPPPASEYDRTMELGWALREKMGDHPMSLSHVTSIGNDPVAIFGVTGYGPYVVGIETQVPIHRGRWFTLLDIVRAAAGKSSAFVPGRDSFKERTKNFIEGIFNAVGMRFRRGS